MSLPVSACKNTWCGDTNPSVSVMIIVKGFTILTFTVCLTSFLAVASQNSTVTPDIQAVNTTQPTTQNKTWKPWCLDSKYFDGKNKQPFGKLEYGQTGCVMFQDAIEITTTLGFGKNESAKCEILSEHVCNASKFLECSKFDRLLPEIGRVVDYVCRCIKSVGIHSFNRTTKKCYIPYASSYQCSPGPNKSDDKLECEYGLDCASAGRGVYRCRCPVGFSYDDDKDGYGGCVVDPENFRSWIGLVFCVAAIWGGLAMFMCVTEDESRLRGFRPKPIVAAEPPPDLDLDLIQPEDAKMIISPDEDFET